MKSTIGYEPSISRIYTDEVFQAVSNSGLQSYTHDNEFYMLKYRGVWQSYQHLSTTYPFLGLPVVDLKALETEV